MDEKDRLILQELKKNSNRSVQEIAKATKVPSTTVHNRIKRLEKDGSIKQYTIKIDSRKTGNVQAIFELTLNPGVNANDFMKSMKHKVDDLYSVAGDYQFLIKNSFHDLGGVYGFAAQLQQMANKVKTTVILEEL
ncbi:MAG TPA: winged helix-turn-helix transcriptional regulator [Candidatus Nanoarchaeia archaeon]|nr:winged helix-turn-helix transcriptional regulator [Candidatus Nanoarchaeia archaeon]